MNKAQIFQVVKQQTRTDAFELKDLSDLEDLKHTQLVREAEASIFSQVYLLENSRYARLTDTIDVPGFHKPVYALPADYEYMISVVYNDHILIYADLGYGEGWTSSPASINDYRYSFYVDSNTKSYLVILPFNKSPINLQYFTAEPSLNSSYDEERGVYTNEGQTNRYAQKYAKSLYLLYLARSL